MEINGKVYCDLCRVNVEKQKHVRVTRPQGAGGVLPQYPHAHFHDRFKGDCWTKVKETARKKNEEKKPTEADMTEYQRWLASKEARAAVAKGGVH